jgi:hypothetical protein
VAEPVQFGGDGFLGEGHEVSLPEPRFVFLPSDSRRSVLKESSAMADFEDRCRIVEPNRVLQPISPLLFPL